MPLAALAPLSGLLKPDRSEPVVRYWTVTLSAGLVSLTPCWKPAWNFWISATLTPPMKPMWPVLDFSAAATPAR